VTEPTQLEALLERAKAAGPGDRIEFRDPIASHGSAAIDAMADWLAEPRLAAFAVRVLERIARDPVQRPAVVEILQSADREDLSAPVAGDIDRALAAIAPASRTRAAPTSRSRASGRPGPRGLAGVRGRGYWVMRTSPWERSYLWSEAIGGRLRQGWGVADEQNLEVIAAAIRRGQELTDLQKEARRALRMLTSWPDGIRVGDLVIAPNLPEYGRLSVFRVAGSYEWAPGPELTWRERFGHVLPVELVIADLDRRGPRVTDALRSALGAQTRLYNVNGYGGDVERLIGNPLPSDRRGDPWTDSEYERLFRAFPPDGPHPSADDIERLASEFGRTFDAVDWQWRDGENYVRDGSTTTMSDQLRSWIDRTRGPR
jgi:hypothetical protein